MRIQQVDLSDNSLARIQSALATQWRPLHAVGDEPTQDPPPIIAVGLRARQDINERLLARAVDGLRVGPGEWSALVLGGGFEVLPDAFDGAGAVCVADLNPEALRPLANQVWPRSLARIELRICDLSGIPVDYQRSCVFRLAEACPASWTDLVEASLDFFANFPRLEPLALDSGSYDLVVSPVLVESLPFGPVTAMLAEHLNLVEKRFPEARLAALASCLGEDFFYRQTVANAMMSVLRHHLTELIRLVNCDGAIVFSAWLRPDEQAESRGLRAGEWTRLGDVRVPTGELMRLLNELGFALVERNQVFGPGMPSTVCHFERGSLRAAR